MKTLSIVFSAIFHPLLMATYSCIILYLTVPVVFSPIPINGIPYFIIAIFLTTAIVPGLSVMLMKYSHHISHFEILERKERKIPFLVIAIFYAITTYMMNERIGLNPMIFKLMVLVTSLIFIIYLINLWFKISVHAAAISGVAGFFCSFSSHYYSELFLSIIILLFVAAGLTLFSRLLLNRHTPIESWAGAILGFLYAYIGFILIG